VIVIAVRGASGYGGTGRLALGLLGEILLSALLAPIRMLFHTQFVLLAFVGWKLQWKSPQREDAATSWREAIFRHGPQTLLGVVWVGGVYWLNPSFVWWLLPVAGALIVSIPVSVYTSRASLGRWLRARGLFVIPEELHPPREIQTVAKVAAAVAPTPGFVDAIVDPEINELLCATGKGRALRSVTRRAECAQLVRRALVGGPEVLPDGERMRIIGDPDALSQLHAAVRSAPDAHQGWREAARSRTSSVNRRMQ
jgi:membrane glycosyltransferase